jgi:hypothetical protein
VVIGVTDEGRDLVDRYVAKNSPKYPIVIESVDSGKTFGLQGGYPTQYVIDTQGKIAWAGNFFESEPKADEILEKLLASARIGPELTGKLAPAGKLLEARKFPEAHAALTKAAADAAAPEADRKAAADAVKWIEEEGAAGLAAAAESETAGKSGAAGLAYETVAAEHKGLDAGTKAAEALKALLADPRKKREVDGAKALAKAREKAADLPPKKAIPVFKGVASSFKGTQAGDEAVKIAAELEVEANR